MVRTVAGLAIGSLTAALFGVPTAYAATIAVDCSHDSLATAISSAPSGSTLKITGTCTGQFTVDRDLSLAGAPSATLDGVEGGRTLLILGFHSVHLSHLVITGGVASDGAGIEFLGGGLLSLTNVKVTGNSATGGSTPGYARGGGIYVRDPAFVTLTDSTVSNNHLALSGANAETADGGGLYIKGALTLTDTTVHANTITASSTNNAGIAEGGGIAMFGGLTMTGSKVTGNHVTGTGPQFGLTHGGGIFWIPTLNDLLDVVDSSITANHSVATTPGEADAFGGGLFMYVDAFSSASIRGSTFDGNQLSAVSGGAALVEGGSIYGSGGGPYPVLTVDDSTFSNGSASAAGGATARGEGGAVWLLGKATLKRAHIIGNSLSIHAAGANATGGGGGIRVIATSPFDLASSAVDRNTVDGTSDVAATSISGGGIFAGGSGPVTIRSSTISRNALTSHAGSATSETLGGGMSLNGTSASPGDSILDSTIASNTATAIGTTGPDSGGGGLAVFDKLLTLRFTTITRNTASATGSSIFAGGGGIYNEVATDTHFTAVVLALDHANTGPDCIGNIGSGGYNLYGTATGCGLTLLPTDRTTGAPKLGPLASNGGPTETVALLTGSPALDRIPKAICQAIAKTDQRGVSRPQGTRCDEGAFER